MIIQTEWLHCSQNHLYLFEHGIHIAEKGYWFRSRNSTTYKVSKVPRKKPVNKNTHNEVETLKRDTNIFEESCGAVTWLEKDWKMKHQWIIRWDGVPNPKVETLSYYLANIFLKMYENESSWTGDPSGSASDTELTDLRVFPGQAGVLEFS